MKRILNKFIILISTIAALCLFLTPSLTSALLMAVVFAVAVAVVLWNREKPTVMNDKFGRILTVGITLWIILLGYDTFRNTWMPSSKIADLAADFHMSSSVFLLIIGMIGCVVGCYAIYLLSAWLVIFIRWFMKEKLPEQRLEVMIANLKQNWFFPVSVIAFFTLSESLTMGYFTGVLIVFAIALIAMTQVSSIVSYVKDSCIGQHVIAAFTALGVCWSAQSAFCAACAVKGTQISGMILIISIISALTALFFVYFCLLFFWKEVARIISENRIFTDMVIAEWVIYGIIICISIIFMAMVFGKTDAFYGTAYDYDIIYTSDSPTLVKENAYLVLTHLQNDLRQPLFAVFAAPFLGLPYLIGKLFDLSASVQAMLLNGVQIILLFAANFLLARMMKLNSLRRICFMLLSSCTYMYLLFSLMMEQYIIAYFWLAFCLYLISEKKYPDKIVMWGAGGTLLTSMILLPLVSDKSPWKDVKAWIVEMTKCGLEFVALMLVFCRFDVFFNLATKVSMFTGFTGKSLTWMDKVRQYTAFVHNCFVIPDAGISAVSGAHTSWQLHPVAEINIVGIIIILLVIVSGIWNRKKRSSLLAFGWVLFSVVMLLVLGWGTNENGLILYALYFGWAFLVLLFQLVESIESKLNVKFILPIFSLSCTVILISVNMHAMRELVNFAITYYPI